MQTIIGLMSGTSLDGVDVAACRFWQENETWHYAIDAANTYPFSKEWKIKLENASLLSGLELQLLHNEFGRLLGNFVQDFISNHAIHAQIIASHGHTIFHQPDKKLTVQIGSGAEIAAITCLDVINDFRVIDVALNGQGAPLVPIGDELLFAQYDACVNLGGFANISTRNKGKRIAWDICPVNIALNYMAQKMDFDYDKNGELARSGKLIPELYEYLLSLSYYQLSFPKSLGKEWVETHIFSYLSQNNWNTMDVLHTLTQHCAQVIAQEIQGIEASNALFTGGGTLNTYLMELIRKKTSCSIIIPAPHLIHFKEALIFAFLGHLRSLEHHNSLQAVTGATRNSIGGSWWKGISQST